jgi:hypothetical protein
VSPAKQAGQFVGQCWTLWGQIKHFLFVFHYFVF